MLAVLVGLLVFSVFMKTLSSTGPNRLVQLGHLKSDKEVIVMRNIKNSTHNSLIPSVLDTIRSMGISSMAGVLLA